MLEGTNNTGELTGMLNALLWAERQIGTTVSRLFSHATDTPDLDAVALEVRTHASLAGLVTLLFYRPTTLLVLNENESKGLA